MRFTPIILSLVLSAALPACAARTKQRALDDTTKNLRQRSGLTVDLKSDPYANKALPEVEETLKRPLTADDAVRVAVLNNKKVRAELEELGVAASDLVAATRPPNPGIEGHATFDSGSVKNGNYGATVEMGLTALMSMGKRKTIAKHVLAMSQLRTTQAVMDFAMHVRSTFLSYVAARKLRTLSRSLLDATEAGSQAAEALFEAGNVPELDLQMQRAFLAESRLNLALADRMLLDLREQMNSLLGVWGPYTRWESVDDFPALPSAEIDDQELERRTLAQSLELAAFREQIEAQAARVGLAKLEGLLPDLTLGVDLDFEEGFRRIGPIVTAQLPLFDQGQAETMRAMAGLEASRARYVATAIELRASARRTRGNLRIARSVLEQYQTAILPLRKRVLQEQVKQYNAMQAGVFNVLAMKRAELEAAQGHVRAQRDYWVARAELVQLLAGAQVSGGASWASANMGSAPSAGGH